MKDHEFRKQKGTIDIAFKVSEAEMLCQEL